MPGSIRRPREIGGLVEGDTIGPEAAGFSSAFRFAGVLIRAGSTGDPIASAGNLISGRG